MALLNIVLFAALCASAFADVASIRSCNSSSRRCSVSEVRISPCYGYDGCRITKGEYASAAIDFTPNFSTRSLGAKVYLGDSYFMVASDNACDFTSCPTTAGQSQTLNIGGSVSEFIISATYDIRVEIYNKEDSDEYCCFKTTVKF